MCIRDSLNIDVSLDKGKIRKKTGLFAKIVQRNYTAVSYTHLDVYKRQGLFIDDT